MLDGFNTDSQSEIKLIADLRFLLVTERRFARVRNKNIELSAGQMIGVRPNLNTPKSAPLPVQTIHRGLPRGTGFWRGEVLSYAAFVILENAFFSVDDRSQKAIAAGETSKFPMASVDGVYDKEQRLDLGGMIIRFNPKIHRRFVDEAGRAVKYAQHVTVWGNRVYARGEIIYE